MIKVANQGQKIQEVAYRAGMTVTDVLTEAKVEVSKGAVVSINGTVVDGKTPVVADGSTVVITPKIKNG